MKRRGLAGVLLAVFLLIGFAPAALAAVPDRPENQYVLDSAGVISSSTEREIVKENRELFQECGAEVVIVAVDFLGGQDIEDYAYELFNSWGIGSQERDNGILLVLAIGEGDGDYYAQAGSGIDGYFDGAKLQELLDEYLEEDFAAGDYDKGVENFFDAVVDEIEDYYEDYQENEPYGGHETVTDGRYSERRSGLGKAVSVLVAVGRVVVVAVVILLVFNLIGRMGRGGRGGPGGGSGGGGGFWQGMMLGSMMNRRRSYWRPPPPPPPGGFGGPGFGGPHPPRGGFGGFTGGGRSHGGGAGRGGFGGGGFHGGGGSRGGGAGRR
ncbi:TPM domain-containing protein [Acutalibacter sp. 1XD8-33]|uniref:TPM domain-containing protein n=1 Tax=Acutalibacter sp. 1XD8-33 TaxID=2320081 RepID=UPI000EA35FB1|nr:TPM domain-containing protein [Acutalibacter sp. 1XD8-33]RKJ41484.1 TPM domain-containing protein [Acutalibacter sp. 1XD8-33]